jgi:hypothetical protein
MNDRERLEAPADFYDTYGTSGEMEGSVEVEPARAPSVVFSVRLIWSDMDRLRRLASERGEQPRSMVGRWISDRVLEETIATQTTTRLD